MKKLLIAALLLVSSVADAQESQSKAVPPETRVLLDASLKKVLTKKYSGYRLAWKKDYFDFVNGSYAPKGPHHPWSYGALKADFNGDGFDDYTLLIRFKNRFRWLAAIKKGDSYEIEDFGPPIASTEGDPPSKPLKKILFLLTTGPAGELSREDVSLNPFPYIHFIGDGECIEAYWKDGRWNKDEFVD